MFTEKKSQYKYNAIISTILVLGILIVAGLISTMLPLRGDLTENKEFSISDATIGILKDLDDVVNVKAYFSEKLPAEFLNVRQTTKDILGEYENYSRGDISIEFIDPKDDEDLQKEARSFGIPELQFSNVQKDKYEMSKGYLGVVILYADNKEVIPVIKDTSTLEYNLTAAIKKVTLDQDIKIRFATGNGELDNEEQISKIYKGLAQLYNVSTIDLSNGNLIPDDVTTLVIAGPTEKFSLRSQYVVDQFFMRGGSLLILNGGVKVGEMLRASSNVVDLEKLIKHYGIEINSDLVLDNSCEMAQFTSGYTTFITPYSFWPKIGENGFNQESSITGDLENLVLPWTSSLDISQDVSDGMVTRLVMSSNRSWVVEDSFNIAPDIDHAPGDFEESLLAASASGKFTSFFAGKSIPQKEISEDSEDMIPQTENEKEFLSDSQQDGRIVVVGSANFIEDSFLQRFPENAVFFQNILDSVSMDDALISIRSRTASSRPLKDDLSETVKAIIKFINIFFVSIILAIFGIIKWTIRRKISKEIF
ncbi:hypothetical protein D4R87_03285 [bacterium]|nr:MAG: hypothetical protein D4R87_03285 [bacterium]